MNTIKSVLLLGVLTGLLMFIGGLFGGKGGVMIAFLFAVVMNFGAYWFSDKIVLRMYKAQEVTEQQAPEIYALVKNLVLRASMPMPKVYIIPEDTPNAFATGRDERHAVVAVTEGILRILSREELEGVLAHELTHIKHKDMLIGSIAATLAGAIVMLANMAQWAAIFGGAKPRQRRGRGQQHRRPDPHGRPGAPCRDAHPDGHLPLPGISRRRGRGKDIGQPLRSGRRPGEACPGPPRQCRWTRTPRRRTSSSSIP